MASEWGGHIAIHSDKGVREATAHALAKRLGLSTTYVKMKLDSLNRLRAYYEREPQ